LSFPFLKLLRSPSCYYWLKKSKNYNAEVAFNFLYNLTLLHQYLISLFKQEEPYVSTPWLIVRMQTIPTERPPLFGEFLFLKLDSFSCFSIHAFSVIKTWDWWEDRSKHNFARAKSWGKFFATHKSTRFVVYSCQMACMWVLP
jgi:hypothetical protein